MTAPLDPLTSGCCSPARKIASALAEVCPEAVASLGYRRTVAASYAFLKRLEALTGIDLAGDDPSEENHCPHCEQEVHDAG